MTSALLLQVGPWTCALPLASVAETMRTLPCKSLSGVPNYVLGVSLIRGVPTPVLDLRLLLGVAARAAAAHLVCVRCGADRAALAVDRVLGVQALPELALAAPRGVLGELPQHHVESLRRLDGELLAVLATGQLLPAGLAERARLLA